MWRILKKNSIFAFVKNRIVRTYLKPLNQNKMSRKICPECGSDEIEMIDDEYARCLVCGLEEHVSVFIN